MGHVEGAGRSGIKSFGLVQGFLPRAIIDPARHRKIDDVLHRWHPVEKASALFALRWDFARSTTSRGAY
jgi:hypothetical protein